MARQVLLFLLVAFLNVSLILCREDYQHHISDSFSHHHRRSTPEDSVVSTKDPLSVTEGEGKPLGEIQHGYDEDNYTIDDDGFESVYNTVLIIEIVLIVLSLLSIVIGLLIIFCCGKKICRKVHQGFVVKKNEGNSVGIQQTEYSVSQQQLSQNPGEVEMHSVPPATS